MIELQDLETIIKRVSEGKATVEDIQNLLRAITEVGTKKGQTVSTIKNAEDITKFIDKIEKFAKDNKKVLSEISNLDEELLGIYEKGADIAKDKIEDLLSEEEINKKELKEYQKVFKHYKDLARKQNNHLKSIEKGREATKQMLQATIGLSEEWNKISAGGFLKGFTKQLKSSLSLSNILMTAAKGLVETGLALDSAGAELFKSTGIEKAKNNIEKQAAKLGSLGVNMKSKVAESTSALFSALKGYNDLTERQTDSMEEVITLLGERGASKTAAADSMVFLQRTLGKTPEAAAHSMLRMTEFADSIGRPIEEMVSDFGKASPMLAMYGDQSEKIFKGLSLEAQNLNMELTEVLSLGLTMDSFEGAAKAAQNFNLAFGGPFLSAQALMAASVEDKYKMIAKAYRDSGAELSRREISGLARDAGIDEQKLMQILNREESRIKKPAESVKTAAELMESQMAKVTRNLSLDTTLKMTLEKLYMELFNLIGGKEGMMTIMNKVVDGLKFVADNIKEIFSAMVAFKVISKIIKAKGILYPMLVANLGGMMGAAGAGGKGGKGGKGAKPGALSYAGTKAKTTMGRMTRNPLGLVLGAATVAGGGYALGKMTGIFGSSDDKDSMTSLVMEADALQAEAEAAAPDPAGAASGTAIPQPQPSGTPAEAASPVGPPPGAPATPTVPAPAMPSGTSTPGGTSMPSRPNPGAASRTPEARNAVPMATTNEDDYAGGVAFNMKMGNVNSTSRTRTTNKSSQYVIPTFNKSDKIYPIIAAKPGGDIISSLTELEEAVNVLYEALKNSKSDLSIEGKELVRAFKLAYNENG